MAGDAGSNTIPREFSTCLDPCVALTVAATATRTGRLGTNVFVAPWYPPVQLARQLTSIHVISGDRLMPGFGVGWSHREVRCRAPGLLPGLASQEGGLGAQPAGRGVGIAPPQETRNQRGECSPRALASHWWSLGESNP
ncbi:LLM class flavin-dependent oxidoreductase [Nocardia sp. NPDC051787]|uniref:LLM class flavin-dependent oxidoreductase n=1 Tax=Nocardia sp. NPDC051787 TaxID=3155415 RepID=UPI00341A2B40